MTIAGATDAGAATWGNGLGGTVGAVSAANSLVGTHGNDEVSLGGVTALTNGNFVVDSDNWTDGGVTKVGAVTWGNGTNGEDALGSFGAISDTDSFVGSTAGDNVGIKGVTALSNGNYVVDSFEWSNGGTQYVGAVTWGNGTNGENALGAFGAISAANSLVGTTANDQVGKGGVTALTNGNFVVASYFWHNGGLLNAGAATWGNGANGEDVLGNLGAISTADSLVGDKAEDEVGLSVTALSNGNFVIDSSNWVNGTATQAGAVTWGNGTTGKDALGNFGAISTADSLVGDIAGDGVGVNGITALSNGNFVMGSRLWQSSGVAVGAVTWGCGTNGEDGLGNYGAISAADSSVGTVLYDTLTLTVKALSNGNYVIVRSKWDDGATTDAGAATWVNGTTGQSLTGFGAVNAQNSIIGDVASANLGTVADDPTNDAFVVAAYADDGSGRVVSGFPDPNALNKTRGGSAAIDVTPDFLADTLDNGTAVSVYTFGSVYLNSPLTVSASGSGGALSLNAQSSLAVDAEVDTDNGNATFDSPNTLVPGGQTINVGSGTATFDGALALGSFGGTSIMTVDGNLDLASDLTWSPQLEGTVAGTSYDQIVATGGVTLNNATLNASLNFTVAPGQSFTLINNQSNSPVSGTFDGLPEGAALTLDNQNFTITYKGGDGNDVVLAPATAAPATAIVNSLADNTTADSVLTLREAVEYEDGTLGRALTSGEQAQVTGAAGAGGTITFASGGTITLSQGVLDLSQSIAINGPGANSLTIDGSGVGDDGIFDDVAGQTQAIQDVSITGLTLTDSHDGNNGAIDNQQDLTLAGDVISKNAGLGVYNTGTLNSSGDTFVGNNNTDQAGGAIENSGTWYSSNDTFSGNSAGVGGAIFSGGTATLTDDTITQNTVENPYVTTGYAGGVYVDGGTVTLANTIIAGNTDTQNDPDVYGTFDSLGHNLIGDGTTGSGFVASDQVGTTSAPINPLLAPLGNYGGTTPTAALLPGSPAIGAGTSTISTVEQITIGGDSGGTVGLAFNGGGTTAYFTSAITTASGLQSALDGLSTIGGVGGSAVVQLQSAQFGTEVFDVTLGGAFAGQAEPLIVVQPDGGTTASASLLAVGGSLPTTDQTGYTRSLTAPSIGAYENEGFTITPSGTPQSIAAGSPFATPLGVTVTSNNALLTNLAGGLITFTAPMTGASATFSTNPITLAANGTGSTIATANANSGGPYNVTATASGIITPATFDLTNSTPKVTPSINTTAQPTSATVGTSIADKATITGGNGPTGTVTFKLFANAAANGTPLFTDTESLTGGTATSKAFTTTTTGTLYWVDTYNGDTHNNAVTSADSAEPVVITPPGSLAGSSVTASTSHYNLTALGTSDWAHWGTNINAAAFDHKATGGSQISNITKLGSGSYGAYSDPSRTVFWTDGTPLATDTGDQSYVWANNAAGAGYSFTVPASTTTRTVYLDLGGYDSGGTLTAHLSDSSARNYTVNFSGTSIYTEIVAITYKAGSSGQTLTLSYVKTANVGVASGSVDLVAAWLDGAPVAPQVTLNPKSTSVTAGATVTLTAAASGTPTPAVQWQSNTGPAGAFENIPGATSTTYTFTATTAENGEQYRAVFTNSANYTISSPATLTVTAAPLAGSVSPAAASYNLTTLGTTDWAHWGSQGNINGLVHKATGGSKISNVTRLGTGGYGTYTQPTRDVSWTDGTPTATDSGDHNYLWANNAIGAGYSFTVPASTTAQTLYIYLGGYSSYGTLTAHLSDNSAPNYVTTLSGTGLYTDVIALTFKSKSAAQTLTLSYVKSQNINGTGGSVDLMAAWLA